MLLLGYTHFQVYYQYIVDLEYNKCRDPANLQLSSNWTSYTEEIYLCGVR